MTKLTDYLPCIGLEETNLLISNYIHDDKEFIISRIGEVELKKLNYINYVNFYKKIIDPNYYINHLQLIYNAGFFHNDFHSLNKFNHLMINSISEIDIYASWLNFEKNFENKFKKNVHITHLPFIEPYYSQIPWTRALKGKTVLVIHPFVDSISYQYENRPKLFKDPNILPEFNLKLLKPPQTNAGNFERNDNWFDNLNNLKLEALDINFDIALIAAGSYGLPISYLLKKNKKKVINLGGALQILFGIRGRRWDTHPFISKLYNNNWIRPFSHENIPNQNLIENSCYW